MPSPGSTTPSPSASPARSLTRAGPSATTGAGSRTVISKLLRVACQWLSWASIQIVRVPGAS
jgi:hypothetical protein